MASRTPPQISSYFYILSQSWTPALKYHRDYRTLGLKEYCYWVLHGLWLNTLDRDANNQRIDLKTFDYVAAPEYQAPTAGEGLAKLESVAPSLIEGRSDDESHRRLYDRHGKCVIHYNRIFNPTSGILTPQAYLCKAAELATTYNIGQYRRKMQLGADVTTEALCTAISTKINAEPNINYIRTSESGIHTEYLDQIYLYFDSRFNLVNSHDTQHVSYKAKYLECKGNFIATNIPEPTSSTTNSEILKHNR